MPELPEVTTVISILNQEVKNKTILDVEVLYKNMIKTPLDEFVSTLKNKKILDITRLGKHIIFHLSEEVILLSHLRMEGKYYLLNSLENLSKHTCVIFKLDTGEYLAYLDTRKFGVMELKNTTNYLLTPPLSSVGYEPMSITTDEKYQEVYKKLTKKKPIKELLLDQSIMAGIGNIYADEILYACNINPLTLGSELTTDDYYKLIESSKTILLRAIELGGSTIKSYHPKEGMDGNFQIELKAYGRENEPCLKCGTRFHKIFLGGRGTTFCPNCQINHNLRKAIGITGSIGAGKSTVTEIFKKLGYKTYSSDKIVADLYQNDDFKKILVKNFSKKVLNENNSINKDYLRDLIQNSEELQGKLENLVFPYVENEIIDIIKNSTDLPPVIEVPLLAKAHIEYLFKTIIFVDANEDIRLKRLQESRPYDAKKAIELYKKNNTRMLDNAIILMNNYDDVKSLKKDVKSIIKTI